MNGRGDESLRDRATAALEDEMCVILNQIADPCSVAAGSPIGLVDMGIVQHLEITGDSVRVKLLPTFPTCRFVPIFEAEIRRRLKSENMSVVIEVAEPDVVWDESMMKPEARRRLAERRLDSRSERPSPGMRSPP
jgi:metal-sulfur cluster biosynthetic enzyme